MERMIARAEADATNSCLKCGKERYAFSNRCRCCTLLGYLVKNILTYEEDLNYHTQIYIFWSVEYFWHVWYFIREKMGKRQPDRIIELLFRDLTPHDKARVSNYLLKVGVPAEMYPRKPSLEEHIELEKQLYDDLDGIFSRLDAVRSAAASQTTPGVTATESLGVVVEGAIPVLYRPSCTEEAK